LLGATDGDSSEYLQEAAATQATAECGFDEENSRSMKNYRQLNTVVTAVDYIMNSESCTAASYTHCDLSSSIDILVSAQYFCDFGTVAGMAEFCLDVEIAVRVYL
jgi:hypothetical protein